jgi:hypothetical protein
MMALNEKYSGKDLSQQSFKSEPAADFNNSEIRSSNFAHCLPVGHSGEAYQDIFPTGMTGVEFVHCNLDNVLIPVGNTMDARCSNRRIKNQNDKDDWVVDAAGKPVEPTNKFLRLKPDVNASIDPKDIPPVRVGDDEMSDLEKKLTIRSLTQERDKAQAKLDDASSELIG